MGQPTKTNTEIEDLSGTWALLWSKAFLRQNHSVPGVSGGLGDNGCSISFFCKADGVAGVVAFQVYTVFKSPM